MLGEGPEDTVSEKELITQAVREVTPWHRKAMIMEAVENRSQLDVTEGTFSGFVSRERKEPKEATENAPEPLLPVFQCCSGDLFIL